MKTASERVGKGPAAHSVNLAAAPVDVVAQFFQAILSGQRSSADAGTPGSEHEPLLAIEPFLLHHVSIVLI